MAKGLCNEKRSVVMVLHNIEHALSIADNIILMNEGRVLLQGSVDEVFNSKLIDKVFNIELIREYDHWWCKKKS